MKEVLGCQWRQDSQLPQQKARLCEKWPAGLQLRCRRPQHRHCRFSFTSPYHGQFASDCNGFILIADLFTTNVAPFDHPSVHFSMIFPWQVLTFRNRPKRSKAGEITMSAYGQLLHLVTVPLSDFQRQQISLWTCPIREQ